MSENPPSSPGGLGPLGQALPNLDQPPPTEWRDHDAVVAAQRLWEKVNLDPKTNLLSQEAWMQGFQQVVEQRTATQAVVVHVLDLDGFKAVNDTLGHGAGDKLLGIAGQAVDNSFQRKSDTKSHGSRENEGGVARLGGDEYAAYEVIDTSQTDGNRALTNALDATAQSQRVNENFQKLLVDSEFSQFALHLSLGSASVETGQTPEDGFALADHNMFVAKYRGKIDQMSLEDREQLRDYTLPHLRKINARIEPWLEQAAAEAA